MYDREKFYRENPHLWRDCPVKGCKGYGTTTPNFKMAIHIKRKAMSELFQKEFFPETETPHLDYVKRNCMIIKKQENKIVLGEEKQIIYI